MHQAHTLRSRESILVVGDTPAHLNQLAGLLAEKGYQVRIAPSVDLVMRSVQTSLPDLILLVQSANPDGYEIYQLLQADERTCNIPIILLDCVEGLKQARSLAADDYMASWAEAEEVLLRVETQLMLRRMQTQRLEQEIELQRQMIQRKQAEQALEQQLQKTQLLQQVTEAICSQTESQQILKTVVERVGRILQVSRCSVHIYVPPPIPEILLVAEYVEPGFVSIGSIDLALEDEVFIPEVLTQNRAVVSVDTSTDARLDSIQALCQIGQIKSLVAVRTSYKNQVNGVLTLQQCDRQREWAADEISLIETIAAQIGIALAQAKSVEQEQKQLEAFGYQNLLLRQEICERRQIEMALQASETELRSLFAAMMDVVLVLDCQGRYLRIAPTNPEDLYRPASDLLGKTLHDVFPQDQADQFLAYIQASLETRQPLDCEYCQVIQGQDVWFSAKISPNGKDTVLWVARDITARKQAETELLQKSATLSEFSTNLKQLHRLSLTDFETIEALCADYLKTGCDVLGFSWGLVRQCGQGGCRLLAVHREPPTVDAELNFLVPSPEMMEQDIYCGEVLQRKQTVRYGHVSQIENMRQHPLYQSLKMESYIGTPIWVDGEVYGTLSFLSTQVRTAFDHHEQEIIELMAQSIGKFMSAHQVKAKRQQAEEELQLLLNVTQAITAAPDFNQALYAALRTLCEATGWIYGEVWLPSADGQVLECSPVWYCNSAEHNSTTSVQQLRQSLAKVTFQPNEGIAGRVWSQQQPEWTLEESGDATFLTGNPPQHRFQLVNHYGIKARLGVPITVPHERNLAAEGASAFVDGAGQGANQATNGPIVLAVLVFFTAEARPQEQRLIQLVLAVAAQLGTVLAHKRAEAELKALFSAMDDVVLVRDSSGRCLKVASVNPKSYQPAAHILGKTLHETLPQPVADQILEGIRSSLATGTTVRLEYTLPLLHREVCLSASISPLSDESVLIVARDISDRKQIEEALARRERYLAALVEVQQELLAFREQQTRYTKILGLLGQVASASRVYLYENQRNGTGAVLAMQRAVWCAAGNCPNQPVAFPAQLYQEGCARWAEILASGGTVSGITADLPEPERRLLERQGILSILVLPLLVNGEFWGFVGFDDCKQARIWDSLEMSLLNAAAAAIALHHERKLAENALRQSAEREQATLRVIERMRQTLEIEQIFRTTAEELRQLLQCDRVLIYRFNPDWSGDFVAESVADNWTAVLQTVAGPNLTVASTQDERCIVKTWGGASLEPDTYLQETQGGVYSQGAKYLCVQDVHQANFSECYLNLLDKLQAKAYLTVPILRGNRLWGLLASYQNSGPRDWQPSEIHLVTHISTQFGVALQQADLLAQMQQQSADLEKAKDAAEAANRAKTQFLANMSHELRTPLNSILGFTQLVHQEAGLNPEHQGYLNIINRSGQHLLELINDVLEVAKLEANRVSLQESAFDLYALLNNIEEMLRLTALEKQLELHVAVASEVPQHVIADKSKLRQVLLNLLDNAIKFTQVGCVSLHVGLGQNPSGEADPSAADAQMQHQLANSSSADLPNAHSSNLWLHFAVADTGFGIAAEEMDCLFEAFVQTEAGRQSNQGTGLGLVISRRFVDLMGGKLQVQSILGAGSVFEFTIPVQVTPQDLPLPVTVGLEDESTDAGQVEVQCLYQAIDPSVHRSGQLSASDLEVMPPEWIADLYTAASGCSDRQVLQLIEQIPAPHSRLARGLEELVYNFRFEEIIELIKFHFQ